MGFLRNISTLFGRPTPQDNTEFAADAEAVRERFRTRCLRFRRLLSANKAAMETMADVEQRLHTPHPFDVGYVRGVVTRAGAGVFQMIRNLNALSDNRYAALNSRFADIANRMDVVLRPPDDDGESPLVLPLDAIGLTDMAQVGGKMANLGEIHRHVGMPVPDGFAVTARACDCFLRQNGLQDDIDSQLQAADIDNLDALFALSSSIQQRILTAPVPDDLAQAFTAQVNALLERAGDHRAAVRLALRSSAVGEDALGASFAGQYHSELNVHPDEALDVWREIIASKYAVTAMSYRHQRGIPDRMVPMCVGVLVMINARAGGVAYSRDPVRRGEPVVVINAVPGLPAAVVDGSFSPDTLFLSRQHPPRVLERRIMRKPFRFVCDAAHGVQRIPLAKDEATAPAIDDALAAQLATLVLGLEEYYGETQDVEWAVDEHGNIVILQSRPLKDAESPPEPSAAVPDATQPDAAMPDATARDAASPPLPPLPDIPVLLRGGTPVSPGLGMGPVVVLRKDADILGCPEGAVLVVERAGPRWATLLSRAAAIIAEEGGTAGHLASVAREYGVPAIFGLSGALAALSSAPGEAPREVTVDALRSCVYAGLHPELPGIAQHKNLMHGSPVYRILHDISRLMVPLNLLDPSAPEFSPEHCRTLHDITRFCHEKAVQLMFGEEEGFDARCGKQLKAGVKLQYWIIDIDDGFIQPVDGPVVELSNIRSAPMLALWKGMTAIPWAGPPSTDAAGFFSVVMESTMNRDIEASTASKLSNQNFLMISSTFMNLQARFGYHFCTVESQAGNDAHENYVNFQFKGGAASLDRRVARARLVGDVLEECGFRVDVKEDALFATAEGYDAAHTLARTALLGYLVIHTRQVDMVMHNAAYVTQLRETYQRDTRCVMDSYLQTTRS